MRIFLTVCLTVAFFYQFSRNYYYHLDTCTSFKLKMRCQTNQQVNEWVSDWVQRWRESLKSVAASWWTRHNNNSQHFKKTIKRPAENLLDKSITSIIDWWLSPPLAEDRRWRQERGRQAVWETSINWTRRGRIRIFPSVYHQVSSFDEFPLLFFFTFRELLLSIRWMIIIIKSG